MANKTGSLKHGMQIGGQRHKDFEMREATAGDFFSAEGDATGARPISYRAALIARQLVRVGDFTGPFTFGMLGTLSGVDLQILLAAQQELDQAGEAEQPAVSTG